MSSLRRISAPTPFGPPILCAERVSRSAPRTPISRGNAAGRLHGIDMQQAARRMDDRGRLRDRLHHAGLVVGKHERDERPNRPGHRIRKRSEVDASIGIDGDLP